jgi:hypothetical protein
MDGITEQGGGLMITKSVRVRKWEGGGFGWGEFEIRQNEGDVVLRASERPQGERVWLGTWLHDPFPATGADK